MRRLLTVLAVASLAVAPSFADKVSITGPIGPDPPSICDAIASNLVANCGFETGDFTDWNTSNLIFTGVVGSGFDGLDPNSGTFWAALGNAGSDGIISQTLSTVSGQTYTISFYFGSDGGTPNHFVASFGSNVLFSTTDEPGHGYQLYSFTEVATSVSTVLQFNERNDPSYLALDDISVVASTPEPSSILLLLTVVLLGAVRFLKRAQADC